MYRCDQTLIDTAFVKHSSGLYVLSLPEDLLGAPKLDPEMLGRLIGILRGLFSDIVLGIDGHAGREVLSEVLPRVDRVVWLADQSILRSRQSKHLLRALNLQGVSLPGIGLLVDAYQKRLGLEPEHLAELLEIPLLGTLTGQAFNGTIVPLATAYFLFGLLGLAIVLITEKGELFAVHHDPAD